MELAQDLEKTPAEEPAARARPAPVNEPHTQKPISFWWMKPFLWFNAILFGYIMFELQAPSLSSLLTR